MYLVKIKKNNKTYTVIGKVDGIEFETSSKELRECFEVLSRRVQKIFFQEFLKKVGETNK